jgi:predicted DNA-binding transcriptional regulator YafY
VSLATGRLLTLLSLLQTGRWWSGADLSGRLEVTQRTIRRDVERLRDLGYPVDATLGRHGGYRLAAGTAMPPLLLDDDEAVAIAIGLRSAAMTAVSGIEDASVRALAKLDQVLPARLRSRVASIAAATAATDQSRTTVDADMLMELAHAIADRRRLRFRYRARDESETRRTADPERLVAVGRQWYLLAWDHDRGDWRTFRADRIEDPWVMAGHADAHLLPDGVDAVTFVTSQLWDGAPTYRSVVTLHLPADRVRRLVDPAAEPVVALGADRCRLTTQNDTLEWLAYRLLRFGCGFTVHEPAELRDHLRTLAKRIERAAGGRT